MQEVEWNYEPINALKKIAETDLAYDIWTLLNQKSSKYNMAFATRLRHPAVEGIDLELLKMFGFEKLKDHKVRQLIGNMIRQVMMKDGYVIDQQHVKCNVSSLFTKGTRYMPYNKFNK